MQRHLIKILKKILPLKIYQILRVLNFLARRSNDELESFVILDKYSNQLERLKSRQTITDGKLNLVLYGRASRTNAESIFAENSIHDNDEARHQMASLVLSGRGNPEKLKTRYLQRIDNLSKANLFDFESPIVNMLDVGCQNGLVTNLFLKKFSKIKHVVGIDSEQMPFSENINCESNRFIQTNAIDFANTYNGKFDLITLVHSMQRLSPYDQYLILPLLRKSVEKNGYIYIEMLNIYEPTVLQDTFWLDPHNLRPYSISGILSFLEANGFHFRAGVYDQDQNVHLLSDYLKNKIHNNLHCPDLFILIHNA
jgi:SAM-dependent methyltransferase